MIKQHNESDYNLQNTMSFYFYFYYLCFPETEDIVTLYDDKSMYFSASAKESQIDWNNEKKFVGT